MTACAGGSSQRVALSATVMGVYTLLYATVWAAEGHLPGRISGIASTAVMASIALWLRRPGRSRRALVVAGVAFHVVLGVAATFAELWALPEQLAGIVERPSWNAVNILMVPVLVPVRPRNILLVALGLATIDPAMVGVVAAIRELGLPRAEVLFSLVLPQVVCALLAWIPSKVLDDLQQDLRRERRLGAYVLPAPLGQGGMGEVWEATHRFLARPAAVKLIRPELLSKEPAAAARILRRFEREGQVTASLESVHTVAIYDFGIARDGTFYCVMERLRGLDLQELVDRYGALPPARVVHLLLQMCASLDEAHRAGLVHRDVKPANVYVGHRARVYDFVTVLGFGLVKDRREGSPGELPPDGLTVDGRIEGTPAYLSPEALSGERPLDGRADLYAVGCIGFLLLTGRFVFEAPSVMRMAADHLSTPPPRPSESFGTDLPPALETAILRCLAKDPDDPPRTRRASRMSSKGCVAPSRGAPGKRPLGGTPTSHR